MTLCGFGSLQRSTSFALGASFLYSLMLFSSVADAADLYYTGVYGSSHRYPTAQAACESAASLYGRSISRISSSSSTPKNYDCYSVNPDTGKEEQFWSAIWISDTCASGTTWDNETGKCEVAKNKCEALAGTAVASFRFKSTTDGPSGKISKNGCAIELGTGICVTRTAPYYDCTFSGTVTGEEMTLASGQETSDCSGAACAQGQPEATSESTPCTMIGSGGTSSCTSSNNQDNPGNMKCGTANGAYVCTESPKSTSNTEVNNVTQTTTSNSDGSTTTTTKTDTTTTTCKGVGNCTTGTTTTTTTGGTNADGTNKGDVTTCKGPTCNGGTVDPPGEEEEGDDEESSVSGDMVCTALVACSGDAIQCAILRQEQQSRCADLEFRDVSDKKIAEAKSSLDSEFAGADYKAITADADHTFDVSNMIDTSSFLGSSCPALPTINGAYGQFAVSIDFNLDSFCTFLTVLGFINVAFAMKKAAEIIGQGVA
jgi:hypothetical protein